MSLSENPNTVEAPDLSQWTSDEARAAFAEKVRTVFIPQEVATRCKDVAGFRTLHETVKFPYGEGYYETMHAHFSTLFGDNITTSLEDNGWEYIDIIVKGESWGSCELSGGELSEAKNMEETYNPKEILVFRYTR